MNSDSNQRVQELFLDALEIGFPERLNWLSEQCAGDLELFEEVKGLLDHSEPSRDPLEQGLGEPATGLRSRIAEEPIHVDPDAFLSNLSNVGILTSEELKSTSQALSADPPDSDPREIANQLVAEGKLTAYQASALLEGQPELLIDKYLILDLIDVGGMGMVFKAIHRTMNRVVAIKMISNQLLATDDQVRRFQREVRVAATLEHPNIVRAYDADRANGAWFLVMEYVQGKTLSQIVKSTGPMSWQDAADCILQSAKGLEHAHHHNIVHRDIKPGNLMLDSNSTIKILDLGLANTESSAGAAGASESSPAEFSELTIQGTVLGTVSFMSPEQSLDARQADVRSDIYSLGCTWYYLLTAEPVYQGDTILKTFLQHREADIPSVREKRPDVPVAIESILNRMLAKKPDERYQSMANLASSIDAVGFQVEKKSRQTPKRHPERPQVEQRDDSANPVSIPSSDKPSVWPRIVIGAIALGVTGLLVYGVSQFWNPANGKGTLPDPPLTKQLDETKASGADLLASGDYEWQVVERFPEPINSGVFVGGADMTDDELTIVYSQKMNDGGVTGYDFWSARRTTTSSPWSEPIRLGPEVNDDRDQFRPRISADGLVLEFVSSTTKKWMRSTRPTDLSNWSQPKPVELPGKNHASHSLSDDGLTLVTSKIGIGGSTDLFWARRDSLDAPWGQFQPFDEVINTDKRESEGSLSNDGRMLVFKRTLVEKNENSKGVWRCFVAYRKDWDSEWSEPVLLDPANPISSGSSDSIATILPSGKAAVFSSARPGSKASDHYLARIVKKKSAEKK